MNIKKKSMWILLVLLFGSIFFISESVKADNDWLNVEKPAGKINVDAQDLEVSPINSWRNIYCGKTLCGYAGECANNEMCQVRKRWVWPRPHIQESSRSPINIQKINTKRITAIEDSININEQVDKLEDEKNILKNLRYYFFNQFRCHESTLCVNSCEDGVDNDGDANLDAVIIESAETYFEENNIQGVSLSEENCNNSGEDPRTEESNCMLLFNDAYDDPEFLISGMGACTNEEIQGQTREIVVPYSENCDPNYNRVSVSNPIYEAFGDILDNSNLCESAFTWCCIDMSSEAYNNTGVIGGVNNFRYCGDGYCQGWQGGISTGNESDLEEGWTLETAESHFSCSWADSTGTINHDCTSTGIDCDWIQWVGQEDYESCQSGDLTEIDGSEVQINWINSTGCSFGEHRRSCTVGGFHWTEWDFCDGINPTEYNYEETCNDNLDGDCDGDTDSYDADCGSCIDGTIENQQCGVSNIGQCAMGVEYSDCTFTGRFWEQGSWHDCTATLPDVEQCNDGIDNDCDGDIDSLDEECGSCIDGTLDTQSCGETEIGICTLGTEYSDCEYNSDTDRWNYGGWYGCTATFPQTEQCNDIDSFDEDCDGTSNDEDEECGSCVMGDSLDRSCGNSEIGICTLGTEYSDCEWTGSNYAYGEWYGCTATFPQTEQCNDDLDNDCDT
ncbi:hypothetical protein HOD61_02170, partial [archaeon]|nr:hypothetical protein [archaeon]